MSWHCAAIDHGVTIFPFGKIGPCTFIDSSYLKSIDELRNAQRFHDLKGSKPPTVCHQCTSRENAGIESFRQKFNALDNKVSGIQFLDIRNTNLCNLKCRYCGPHFSNQWAQELGHVITLQEQKIDHDIDYLVTDSLQWLYFTGGEPLINGDHWKILEKIISKNIAQNVILTYNTNLTSIKYKNIDIFDLWSKFKHVNVLLSIDAVGEPLNYIRSGTNWASIEKNVTKLIHEADKHKNIKISISPVISILNIWFIDELYKWAKMLSLDVHPNILQGPDYLALNVIPDELKYKAMHILNNIKAECDSANWNKMSDMISNNQAQGLWVHCLAHIMYLDNIRTEKLMDVMPAEWRKAAQLRLTDNGEYQS